MLKASFILLIATIILLAIPLAIAINRINEKQKKKEMNEI